jgi:glycosyltransferase involved in cell wall biosynthesis
MIINKAPLVSVITPSYNQGDFIEETICSVLAQTYANIEYIVVDGASSDSTKKILSGYSHRLSKVISEPDNGQASAINKGIYLASGDIIGWLNSDDILYSDAIRAIVEVFVSNPEVEVVYGNVDYGTSREQIDHTIYGREFEFVAAFRRLSVPIPQQGCFWRRSALEKCGFLNEEWHYVLDRDYFIRLADRCSLAYINKTMGLFRSQQASKSVLIDIKWSHDLIRLYSSYFSSSSLLHPVYSYKSEVMAAALKFLLKAFKIDPLLLLHPFFISKLGIARWHS